jgi:multidrug efflux system membrane fusion protein
MTREDGRLLLLLFAGAAAAACGGGESKSSSASAARGPGLVFPVEVETVQARPVEYAVSAVGSVEAFERVEVTARVGGAIEKVNFQEGANVDTGHVLVEIEPERYRLAVSSAKANVEKAEAAHAEATAGLRRREAVNAKNPDLVREEELDTFRTRMRTAAADVAQQKSALSLAELNLRESLARAPFPGIIQTRNVQTGQYVQPGAVIATLVRREPLLLRFQVPEQDAAALKPGMPVRFTVADEKAPYAARITLVAAAADPETRMVAVTSQVDDPKRSKLRPGTFAQVTVPVGGQVRSSVVPETAVRPSERGFLGFVVEGETARERVLTLGLRTPDGKVEIKDGVKPGEKVVVRGGEALKDGAKVRIETGQGSGDTGPAATPAAASNP